MFAWKAMGLYDYWKCTLKAVRWPDGRGPNLIVDDGGDATMFLMKGREREIVYQETKQLIDPLSFASLEEQALF